MRHPVLVCSFLRKFFVIAPLASAMVAAPGHRDVRDPTICAKFFARSLRVLLMG